LALLKVLSNDESPLTLTELAERAALNTSTTFRLLSTLQHEGFVEQDKETGKYSLGVACLELGSAFLRSVSLRDQALPFLERLRDLCRETVHLAILDQDRMEAVYLEKLEGLLPIIYMASRVGGRSPAYCTGIGKVLLSYEKPGHVEAFYSGQTLTRCTPNTIVAIDELMAHLAGIRQAGFGIDDEEHEPGVKCVAAPIWDGRGRAVAAFSVSGPRERIEQAIADDDLIGTVKSTAAEISARLGERSTVR